MTLEQSASSLDLDFPEPTINASSSLRLLRVPRSAKPPFRNPVIASDYPDPAVLAVDEVRPAIHHPIADTVHRSATSMLSFAIHATAAR